MAVPMTGTNHSPTPCKPRRNTLHPAKWDLLMYRRRQRTALRPCPSSASARQGHVVVVHDQRTVSVGPPRWIGRRHTPCRPAWRSGRPPRRLDQLQHGILGVGRIAVEIEPRRERALKHAAGEDRDVDMGACMPPEGHGTPAGSSPSLNRAQPAGTGRSAAVAFEAGIERQVAAILRDGCSGRGYWPARSRTGRPARSRRRTSCRVSATSMRSPAAPAAQS